MFPETRISRILIEENTFGLGSPGMLTQPRGSLARHVRSYRKARAACGGQGSAGGWGGPQSGRQEFPPPGEGQGAPGSDVPRPSCVKTPGHEPFWAGTFCF